MPIYTESPKKLVVDLINESNPQLPYPLEESKVRLGVPEKITPDGIVNTRIWVFPTNDSPYRGKMQLRYRRIDLRDLFKNVRPEIHKYTSVAVGNSPFTTAQLLADFNVKYGLNLQPEDIQSLAYPAASDDYYPGQRTCIQELRVKPSCLAYLGTDQAGESLNLRWVFTERDLATVITQTDLDGRLYPGGNVFDSNHKVVVALSTYGTDFTSISDVLEQIRTLGGIQFGTGDPRSLQILNYMNTQSAVNTWSQTDTPGEADYGLRTVPIYAFTLPHADYPDANPEFNRIAVINYDTFGAAKRQVGKAYLHYNV